MRSSWYFWPVAIVALWACGTEQEPTLDNHEGYEFQATLGWCNAHEEYDRATFDGHDAQGRRWTRTYSKIDGNMLAEHSMEVFSSNQRLLFDGYVYWRSYIHWTGLGQIRRQALGGGSVEAMTPWLQEITTFCVQDGRLFWLDGRSRDATPMGRNVTPRYSLRIASLDRLHDIRSVNLGTVGGLGIAADNGVAFVRGEALGKVWLIRVELATGRKDYIAKISGGAMPLAASKDTVLVLSFGEVKLFSAHRPPEIFPRPQRR